MGLERLRAIFGPIEISDSERAEAILYRITEVFWRLANKPRALRIGPTWEEISSNDLELLDEKEREYLGRPDLWTAPWVYADIDGDEVFVAIGLGAKRVKFSVNGGKPQLIQETRKTVGNWDKGENRDISLEYVEKIVSFVEQVPRRRLLNGSGTPQIDGLPGPKV